jgi:hypothetical protein
VLLINDFPGFKKFDEKDDDEYHHSKEKNEGDNSITLNGRCTILKDRNKAETYREKMSRP